MRPIIQTEIKEVILIFGMSVSHLHLNQSCDIFNSFKKPDDILWLTIMCGIFGIVLGKNSKITSDVLNRYLDDLFILSESRGKEASGLAVLTNNKLIINKQPIPASEFIKQSGYKKMLSPIPWLAIGHSRLVTNGHQSNNANNQPVVSGQVVAIHNGIIVNDREIIKKFPNLTIKNKVDTEVAAALINKYHQDGYTQIQSVQKNLRHIKGSASMAILINGGSELTLATNTGSLFVIKNKNPEMFVFASEKYILKKITKDNQLNDGIVQQVRAGSAMSINISRKREKIKFSIVDISSKENSKANTSSYVLPFNNSIKTLKKHQPPLSAIKKIKRCSKCILPITMPFISFDKKGVCNFCKLHKSPTHKGAKLLQKYVDQYRKSNQPDCIVALSGGRDSSYGLHYVKNVLKMNPIAYTYDWGMITDTARRNQARMVGALGVEHVIVSADIKQKREHIKKHINSWLKKPDLGMVPLFTAGDKQAEYYIEKLKQQTGIKLVIYCRGNEIEDERFKFGHLGIFDGTPGGVIHDISLRDKVKISLYYLKQYIVNPSYINSSLLDTLFAYLSVYLQPHDFLYLWHYIPWNEKEIIGTLKKVYGWETASDTIATWRIDDGTPSFYNYIYYTVQGFTEHDALRSNQIREGVLSRNQALKIVAEENKIRYKSLKWYFDTLGMDGDKVLRAVDGIPKLYTL